MNVTIRLKAPPVLKLRYLPGATGPAGTITIGTVATGAPGTDADVENTGTPQHAVLDFTIPRGDIGPPNTLAIGTVTTLPYGDPATANINGTAPNQTLDLGLPMGEQGPSGSVTDGDKGEIDVSSAGTVWSIKNNTITNAKVPAGAAIDATKLAFTPAAGIASTDVQGAIEEVAGGIVASQPEGRLSLTSGDPNPVSDVAGATTIYYVPAIGIRVPIYDGSKFIAREFPTQLSLALDATSGHAQYHAANANFDLFAYWTGSALAIGTGPSWAAGAVAGSNTARGTGAGSTELETYLGRIVNKNAIQLRTGASSGDLVNVAARQAAHLGSFRPVVAGQATDTKGARLLFNAYNQSERRLYVTDGTTSHTYSTASFAQYNSSTANRVTVLCGLSGVIADMVAVATFTTSAATYRNAYVAIGLDSTTSPASENVGTAQAATTGQASSPMAFWKASPGLGYHEINWLYSGAGSDTQTWLGTSSSFRIGMTGTVTL